MPNSNQDHDGSHDASGQNELPTVTYGAEGCVMAYWRNVLLVAWGVPSTPALREELRSLMARVIGQNAKISLVHIMFGGIPLPDKEARAGFVALEPGNQVGQRIGKGAAGTFNLEAVNFAQKSILLVFRGDFFGFAQAVPSQALGVSFEQVTGQ